MSLKYRNKETGQRVEVVDVEVILEKGSLEKWMQGSDYVYAPILIRFYKLPLITAESNSHWSHSMPKEEFLQRYEPVEETKEKSSFVKPRKDEEILLLLKKLYEEAIPWMQKLRAEREAEQKQAEEMFGIKSTGG